MNLYHMLVNLENPIKTPWISLLRPRLWEARASGTQCTKAVDLDLNRGTCLLPFRKEAIRQDC